MPVNITGVEKTLKAMRSFDPELNRQMNKQIKAVMIPIRDKARGYAPADSTMLSNWTRVKAFGPQQTKFRPFPMYNQAETIRGIIYSPGNNKRLPSGFQVSQYVANRSAGGAIYETAGRLSAATRASESLNKNARAQFLAPLGKIYGQGATNDQGRLIFRAWAEDQGRATHSINLAIRIAVNTFNVKIKSQVTLAA